MWIVSIISIFLLTFSPIDIRAENSFIASAYNQIKNGRTCGSVTKADLKKAGFTCGFGNPIEDIQISAWEIFEWNIFQTAAENQIDKNKCLAEQITALTKNKNLLETWYSQAAAAWLGMKKSELILSKCNAEVFSRLELANIKRYGTKKAYEMSIKQSAFRVRQTLSQEWIDLCTDDEKISALKAAQSLFSFSLPVISSPDFFEIMEKNRGALIDKQTGKPISDSDLLKSDLQDLSFLKLKVSSELNQKMTEKLSQLKDERLQINQKLLANKKGGSFHFREFPDDGLKDYMYKDETVFQTLLAKGLIGSNFTNLEKTRSDLEKDDGSNKTPVSNGAFCILAKYEPTITGELINFGAEAFFWGKTAAKSLLSFSKYLDRVPLVRTAVKPVKHCMTSGLGIAGCPMIAEQVYNSCGSDAFKSQKVERASKNEFMASVRASDLPAEIGYGTWNLTIDPKETPSCNIVDEKNLMLNKKYKSNCLLDSVLAVAPLKISLPALFLTPN